VLDSITENQSRAKETHVDEIPPRTRSLLLRFKTDESHQSEKSAFTFVSARMTNGKVFNRNHHHEAPNH